MPVDNLEGEKWSLIEFNKPTRNTNYYISNLGRVKSESKLSGNNKLLKTRPDHRGFITASVKLQDGFGCIYVHKEVAKAFIKPKSDEHVYVIHPTHKRDQNRFDQIKWVTEADWKLYIKERKKVFGFKSPPGGGNKKLTEAQVALIKKSLLAGKTRKKMLAKRFGVSSTQIKRIETGENWPKVQPAE